MYISLNFYSDEAIGFSSSRERSLNKLIDDKRFSVDWSVGIIFVGNQLLIIDLRCISFGPVWWQKLRPSA